MHTPLNIDSLPMMEVVQFDDANPCPCCTEDEALCSDNKLCILYWHCKKMDVMYRIADDPQKEPSYVPGLLETRKWALEYCAKNNIQPTWSMVMDEEDYQSELSMTDEDRAERDRKLRERKRQEDLDAKAAQMFVYARHQGFLNARGKGNHRHIDKVDEPCKFLYCDERSDKATWKKDERGKLCAPIRRILTGSECWAHEYHDPRSKALLTPHTCKRLHPNEPGWRSEWNTDRTFRPGPPPNANRFINHVNNVVQRPRRVENGAW